jgi:hypothetical protein
VTVASAAVADGYGPGTVSLLPIAPADEGQKPAILSSDRVAAMKDLVASGRYVPFAQLRQEFAKSGPGVTELTSISPVMSPNHEPAVAGQKPAPSRDSKTPYRRQRSRFHPEDIATDEEAAEPCGGKKLEAKDLEPLVRVPCTTCGLRGHVAGDPDRCYQPISLGLGGSQLRGQ